MSWKLNILLGGDNYIETSLSQKQLTPHNDKVCHLANYEVQTNHNPQYFIRTVSESSLSESERWQSDSASVGGQ